MKKIVLTVFLFFSIVISCNNTDDDEIGISFDRASLLNSWYNDYIQPQLNDFKENLDEMKTSVSAFQSSTNLPSLEDLRNSMFLTYNSWQKVEMFNIGKAEEIYYASKMNVYPVNTARVESNILSEQYDFSNANNNAAQGLPTIDYLLYGIGDNNQTILEKFTNDQKYMNYLVNVTNEMINNTTEIINSWETYKGEFLNSTDNTATSAVNLMINDFLYYYEKGFRANKIGIPGGVFSISPIPENVEGYYSRTYSKTYALKAFSGIIEFFNGTKSSTVSLKSIIIKLDNTNGGENLGNKINSKMQTAFNMIESLEEDFVQQIQNDNTKFLQTYDAIQEVVVLLKVDMLQLLNIKVDYVDADGD